MRYAGTNRSFVGSFSIQRKKETFPIKRMKQNIVKMTPVLVFPSSREQKKTVFSQPTVDYGKCFPCSKYHQCSSSRCYIKYVISVILSQENFILIRARRLLIFLTSLLCFLMTKSAKLHPSIASEE